MLHNVREFEAFDFAERVAHHFILEGQRADERRWSAQRVNVRSIGWSGDPLAPWLLQTASVMFIDLALPDGSGAELDEPAELK